jgi:hypothetical protein
MLLDWISDRVKEEETGCCSGRRAMRIHGGGQATSAPNSQNGSTTTSKVIIYCFHLLYWTLSYALNVVPSNLFTQVKFSC